MQTDHTISRSTPNPLHTILLAFPVALFSSALVSDITYLRTEELQWTNFSAWLIAGGLVFGGLVLVWALISLVLGFRSADRPRRLFYLLVLAVMCVVGLINAFQHSRDGWSSVGIFGLVLSIVTVVLALVASLIAHSSLLNRVVFFNREAAR